VGKLWLFKGMVYEKPTDTIFENILSWTDNNPPYRREGF
jgi:hypothetical protein